MLVLVGLGNPGKDYAGHRHNIGFMAVDAIASAFDFGPERKKFKGIIQEGTLEVNGARQKTIILKPQTYMNESGRSVSELLNFYKLSTDNIIVFHDELDLAPAKLKVKIGGGNAGHNGLRSIDAHIGNAFTRIRLGIGHPGTKALVHNHVLGNFAKTDEAWLSPMLDAIARAAPHLIHGQEKGYPRFQSQVADLMQPAKSAPKDAKKQANPTSHSASGKQPSSKVPEQSTPNAFQDALRNLLPGNKK